MREVMHETNDVVDSWPYVASVPTRDLAGHVVGHGLVEHVYRSGDGRFDHVLVVTNSVDVNLVVVVDRVRGSVFGHRLLDLREEYGLR